MQLRHIEFHILVLSFSLYWAPRRRGREESAFGSRPGSTTLFDATLVFRRTERPESGALNGPWGHERGFGRAEKEVAGAAQDEELISTRKGGSVGG